MNPRRPPLVTPLRLALICAVVAVAALTVSRTPAWRPPASPPPEALWRNGVIVDIRHCDPPRDAAATLECASFHCARKVAEDLTNAQQARLRVVERAFDGDRIRISGTIEQYLRARTLPTGFECEMRHLRDARPRLVFGRRAVEETEFRAGERARALEVP